MRKLSFFIGVLALIFIITGCSETAQKEDGSMTDQETPEKTESITETVSENEQAAGNAPEAKAAPELFYFGHASMCIVTEDDKVIYIDPYCGDDYSRAADLILVTHDHYDHNKTDKVKNRNDGCEIITHKEALQNGEYRTFDFPYVTAESVEAGNNPNHDINECVGYLLTFRNGKTVYISGDTSTTDQMTQLADRNIDYAFFCCDGIYNMDIAEAAACAETVGAKHNIPYHNSTDDSNDRFDRELAQQFSAPNKMVILPGESMMIE